MPLSAATPKGLSQEDWSLPLATTNCKPRDEGLSRGWWPYTRAAKEYLHVSPDILREAIYAGDLPAYAKPINRGRKDSTRPVVFVSTTDIDEWIRSSWKRVTGEDMGFLI